MDPQQEMSSNSNTLENMLGCSSKSQQNQQEVNAKKPRPLPEQALKCPRCDSTNTKFCYYNNYSLSQPRYFCKSCRRYWTKGGTLRNVPVGGGCRKNKRSSSSRRPHDQSQPLITPNNQQNPLISHYDSSDLTLAFARLQKQHPCGPNLGFDGHDQFSVSHQGGSFFDALRCGYIENQSTHFQNLYYENGSGSNSCGDVSNGEIVGPYGGEMGNNTTTATTETTTVTTMKQEVGNGTLWGVPWQVSGDHQNQGMVMMINNVGDVESGRESWNGFGPSWHGLLNSPLM